MVKPDVKVNYYAALEVAPDATVDECKKAYRKLALKWHPDRNIGNEEEAGTRFQAIAAAHEVLGDPTTKAKYDTDRRRATLGGAGPRPAAAAQRPGSYNGPPPSAFQPPPRRTHDPTGWARPPTSRPNPTASSGADRFTNFPGPSPTARQSERRAEAWNYMNAKPSQPGPGPSGPWGPTSTPPVPPGKPTQANSNAQRRQAPPVPPRETPPQPKPNPPELPKRQDPRASRDYGPFGTSTNERTAYAHYNPPPPNTAQRPSVNRSNTSTAQTSHRSGYDPAAGNDERAPSGPSAYASQNRDAEARSPQQAFPPTSPRFRTPHAFQSERRSSVDTRGPNRASTFATQSNVRPDFQAQMKRSQSVRDTTKLHTMPTSPPMQSDRQRSKSSDRFAKERPKSAGASSFNVRDDSDDSSTESSDDEEEVPGPGARRTRPVRKATGARPRTNGRPVPEERPQPGNGPRRASLSGQQRQPQAPLNQPPMYEPTSPDVDDDSNHTAPPISDESISPAKPAPARRQERYPTWAIPTSVYMRSAGKQDNVQDAFQQAPWTYVPEPPLIDVDDGAKPQVNSQTSSTPSSVPHTPSKYKEDMELLSKNPPEFVMHASSPRIFTFSSNFDFGTQNQTRSRSSEDINTNFSPTGQAPIFTSVPGEHANSPPISRRGSPAKRSRDTLSARPSRSHVNTRVSFEGDPSRKPAPSPSQGLYGEVNPQSPPRTATGAFSPDDWQNQHFFGEVPQTSGNAPSTQPPTNNGAFKVPTPPQTTRNATPSDNGAGLAFEARQQTADGDAMDIDTPVAEQSHGSARPVNVAPSPWRMSQGPPLQSANAGRRRSSVQPSAENTPPPPPPPAAPPTEMPSLRPLSETLNGTKGEGLDDMTSLNDSVPFTSKASSVHPSRLTAEPPTTTESRLSSSSVPKLSYPPVPEAPSKPQNWSVASFKHHTAEMYTYISKMQDLHRKIAEHNAQLMGMELGLLRRGADGLQAQGESSSGEEISVEAYAWKLKEEEGWKEYEQIVAGGHARVMAEYVKSKEHVLKLVARGSLPERLTGDPA